MYMKYDRIYPKHKNLINYSFRELSEHQLLCQAPCLAWGMRRESSPLPPCSCTSGEDVNMDMCFDKRRPWESRRAGGSPASNEGKGD